MTRALSTRYIHLQFSFISMVLAVSANMLHAEDLLKKKDVKYLGWQTSKDQFTTCSKTVMTIGDGKIEKTDQTCETNPPPPAFRAGKIKSLDTENRIVEIETGDGKSAKFFYPEISHEEIRKELEDIVRKNKQVFYKSPVQGRAESITTTPPKA